MKQQEIIEKIGEDDRELTPPEYKAISKRANGGYQPANYYRKSLFNATVRKSRELQRKKTIYDDGKTKITVNRSLNQRHADAFSLLYALGKVGKPSKSGEVKIEVSLYQMAKAMGYAHPAKDVIKVKNLLEDMQQTLISIHIGPLELTYQMMGVSAYSHTTGKFVAIVQEKTAKYQNLMVGVAFNKMLTLALASMPGKLAKLKAMIRFILSNRATKHGYHFATICDKLNIEGKSERSRFKRQLIENEELLSRFNIAYDEAENKVLYEQHEGVSFELPLKAQQVADYIKKAEAPDIFGVETKVQLRDGLSKAKIIDVIRDGENWIPVAELEHGKTVRLQPRSFEECIAMKENQ